MFGSWTFAKKLAAGYGLAVLTLLTIAVIAYRTTNDFVENDDRLVHSYNLRAALHNLFGDLVNVETGERGYVITGSDAYLAPYEAALGDLKGHLSQLSAIAAGNPELQGKLTEIRPLIAAKLADAKNDIAARRSGGIDAAAKVVLSNAGKTAMDRIRAITDQLDRQESQRIKERVGETKSAAAWALAIVLWGGLIGIVAVAAIGWLITASLTRQIGTAVGHVQSSSAELQAAASQQASGSREQATAMTEITTTITELLATSRQIADSAQRVAQIAEQTAGGARSGQGAVDLAQDAIGGIRRQVDQIVAYMLELGKKSQQIGAVLDIVSELAEQTNILAINATIEAAGAGEGGKRFAVVADEIRKLADRVGGSTKEIRTLIDDVRSAVNTTVMATETGSKAVDVGSQQVGQVASGFRQIADLVITTTDAAREIELSTKQQTTAVEQVNLAIGSAAQASRETEASAGQTLQTASELAHLSTDLARIIRPQRVAA
ncbi:MAG TPA: methyl-accepting chemotaxis protein [Stellaceae bacterium]|nr:methyl-accepting chemotaxis protein [Stellaceae bacterium]